MRPVSKDVVPSPSPFPAGLAVKICKISEDNENFETEWEEQACQPITKGYWAAGFLVDDVQVGAPLKLFRILRGDIPSIPRIGRFQTSHVLAIQGNFLYTANSVYQILRINRIEIVTEDPTAG